MSRDLPQGLELVQKADFLFKKSLHREDYPLRLTAIFLILHVSALYS
jgi:hypothetical protein